MSREKLAAMAGETDRIVAEGRYITPAGRVVDISAAVSESVRRTRLYLPEDEVRPGDPTAGACRVEITEESTLAAARRLTALDTDEVACLNFASARKPGGGYRSGALAQEESLARASGLAACLHSVPAFYAHHRAEADPLYSDRVIYSPGVPVIRDDDHHLLDEPYRVAMLTAAAPNASATRTTEQRARIPEILFRRANKVLAVAHRHGHHRLVLGAWGCGVFGNDPAVVAGTFAALLSGDGAFARRFTHVVFAVLDRPPYDRLAAFRVAFGEPG